MTVGRVFSLKLRHFGIGLLGSSLVLLLDQASKSFMIELLSNPPHVIPISSFFNLALGFNRGVSFGLLNDLGTWGPIVLSSLAVVIVGFLLVWLWNAERAIDGAAISLIIGGALGNLLDRIRVGAVTDFLDFFIGVYHWPAFNLADTGIFTGAALLVIQSFRTSKKTIQDCAEDGSIE
ncbi:MAG: signal peptidase II [Bacteroidetes bacterium]|jgi:signal peptidase II|uniref:signal peptidase II n=1 Tax=Candidatus Pelagibacter TaxID=198251 RepID=UPI0029FAE10C|nr:signal peptidase II [Bacteroidota bacterium]